MIVHTKPKRPRRGEKLSPSHLRVGLECLPAVKAANVGYSVALAETLGSIATEWRCCVELHRAVASIFGLGGMAPPGGYRSWVSNTSRTIADNVEDVRFNLKRSGSMKESVSSKKHI